MPAHFAHLALTSPSSLTFGMEFVTFNRPQWWLLMIPIGLAVVWIGRKTLSGNSTRMRRAALFVRLLLAAMLIASLAEPQWRKDARSIAVTAVLDMSRSQPLNVEASTREFLRAAAASGAKPSEDRVGLVTAAKEAYVQQLPRVLNEAGVKANLIEVSNIGATDGTNLEAAVRIALASMPNNAANRILLVSDGNENIGNLMEAVHAAKAAKVPIDVLPIRYVNNTEVLVERMIAPSVARIGENAKLRVVIDSSRAARGFLTVMLNGTAIDINGEAEGVREAVELTPGANVREVLVKLPREPGPAKFEAVFEPLAGADGKSGDTILENNRAMAVTFVGGEGRVLVLTSRREEASALVNALRESRLAVDVRDPADAPGSLPEMGGFECIVLVNTPRSDFTQAQQEDLRAYVHDLGGGLVMVGGDESFGAGGWIGSSLADALPIKLDPPQKREMPRGALALIMHSCEMPQGNYWGRRCGEAAISALSSKDLVGIVEYNWQGGPQGDHWVYPMREVGDKSGALRAINSLTYGDAPSFDDLIGSALTALKNVAAGQRHMIIISDGDPQLTNRQLLTDCVAAKITISTVAVFPHSFGTASGDLRKMKMIADTTGGRYYEVTDQTGNINRIPEFFIKEAKTVKRALIWEGDPFVPAMTYPSDAMRGVGTVPPITGYIVAGDREGLSQVVLRGKENDPILAQWQYGLGRSVTFTSDATGKWAARWMGWQQYRAFWEQHVRWAMRPVGSPNMRVTTDPQGDMTKIVVEALDDQGDRMNFLRWDGRVVGPAPDADGKPKALPFELRQVGPGRYEAMVPTAEAGAHVMNMNYRATIDGKEVRGSVQAALTRPFSDEYRTKFDNAALLEQVAEATGGKVLTFEDAQNEEKNPWRRAGVVWPVSLTPIFLTVALIAMGLLLADVAVRRVRLDVRAMGAWVARQFRRGPVQRAEQVESLKAVREKARQRLDAASKAPQGHSVGTSVPLADQAASYANAKFEASSEELAAARGASAVDAPPPERAPVQTKPRPGDKPAGNADEEGMSRLLKAKKRAQEERGE